MSIGKNLKMWGITPDKADIAHYRKMSKDELIEAIMLFKKELDESDSKRIKSLGVFTNFVKKMTAVLPTVQKLDKEERKLQRGY